MAFIGLSRSAMDRPGGEPGVWVPLRLLRRLNLSDDERYGLQAELAELKAAALRQSLEERRLEPALAAHDELVVAVEELLSLRPELEGVLWPRYGELLGQLAALGHGTVFSTEAGAGPVQPQEEAEICRRLAGILEQGLSRPCSPPEWLPVLEEQLVHRGALAWQQRMATDPAAAEPCLDLFLRLAQLVHPLPEWIEMACRRALTPVIEQLPELGSMTERDLGLLIERVSRLPVRPERRGAFEAALLRARLSLELQQQGRPAAGRSPEEGQEVLEAEWLDEGDGPEVVALLRLVVTAADALDGPEVFSLDPFLEGDGEGVEAALEVFLQPWRGSGRAASPAIRSLLESLQLRRWPLGDGEWMVLRRAALLWQNWLEPQIVPLPAVEWQAGRLVVELDPLELMVLRHAGAASEMLEDVLGELRRRHHDVGFWSADPVDQFPALPDPLEVLRRFEAEAGFYATTHAPLESLRHWARPALQALLRAQVWSADPSTQSLWLPWGLQGMETGAAAGCLREPPSAAGLLVRLAGEEVVMVGGSMEAIRETHQAGRLFPGGAFGLRCLEVPESRHPHRPAAGFEYSLERLVQGVEQLYRERPFTALVADGGAYRLPLAQAIADRFGVLAVAVSSPLAVWLEGTDVATP